MTNRIPGLGPSDSNKPVDRQSQREAAQRIEKVGEVDPDEQARQRRFQEIMQSNAEEDEEDSVPLPSPFDLSGAKDSSSSDFGMDEIPSSSYSRPPTLSPSAQGAKSDEDLPQSDQFWQETDLPDQLPGKPHLQEKTGKAGSPGAKKTDTSASPFGPPGKKGGAQKAEDTSKIYGSKKKSPIEETPSGRYWNPETELSGGRPGFASEDSKKKTKKDSLFALSAPETSEDKSDEKTSDKVSSDRFASVLQKAQKDKSDQDKKQGGKKKEEIQIIPPSLPELPASIQPAAIAATQAAASYLRPEAIPLFYQMVGSIGVMSTPPGISRTELLLNNPAFAGSKFFSASIELIKYSTAPDSYNIRLSGSNEAVAAFNQNLGGLTAAFQTGHFSFRIGRIDAEYSVDRPVLRRKESRDDDGGGQSNQDKRRQ